MDNNGKVIGKIAWERLQQFPLNSTVSGKDCSYREVRAPVMSHLIRKNVMLKGIVQLVLTCANNHLFKA